MRKIFIKCVFLIVCMVMGFGVFAQKIPPPGLTCCDLLYQETNDLDAYNECVDPANPNPNAYCENVLPIDNSLYIYISIVAGVALASFVIARRMKT